MKRKQIAVMALAMALGIVPGQSQAEQDHPPHATGTVEETGGHVHGSHAECPLPKNAMEVLRCAQEEHPDVRRAKASLSAAETLTEVAAQLPNPELQAQSVFGNVLGDQVMDTQVSLVQPIQLGGKRSARREEAQAQQAQAGSDVKKVQAEVIVATVTHLYRLRQIEAERATLDESISTYTKLVAQYRTRAHLAPEQEVSRLVFEMAIADSRLKKIDLLEEERKIGNYFHLATGHGVVEIRKVLPEVPRVWPKIESVNGTGSPTMIRLLADQKLALAGLEAARAQSWPDLRIGPMVQILAEGPIRSQNFGFALGLELPLFSLNGGGRAHASRALLKAEKDVSLLQQEEQHGRADEVRQYVDSIEALEQAASVTDVERKHQRIEALTQRGLVSSALAIEAHRQQAELEKSRHVRELKAIEALWTIRKLDGRIFEETL